MSSLLKANYHPVLFFLMTCIAVAELGLTAFLITAGNNNGTWPSTRYHHLLILFCFNSAWTTLFSVGYLVWMADAGIQILASIASSVIWLLITSVLWGVAAGLMRITRSGGDCAQQTVVSRCRQSLTVEAFGWTEFGLCVLALMTTCLWICSTDAAQRSKKLAFRDAQRLV